MKILSIRGKNLASLRGEFEVNFRTEPLRSAGLFAITGSTGSGKTTILDAMCVALYEKTPRLESIQNKEVIEVHGKTRIYENNAKTILSKGSHHGYAETEFLAVDGKEYRVRVTISRASKQADGNFRDTEYDVFNITDGTHTTCAATEYRKLVPSLVGLTYEEFTRAVLLSQGNFAAFLKAPENEKATILQKLTGTEIYRRISRMIYRRHSAAKQELAVVQKQMDGIIPLPKETLEELDNSLKELELQNMKNEEALTRLAAGKQWIERSLQLERELAEAQKNHEKAMEQVEQCCPIAEKVKLIDSVQEIRDTYMQRVSVAEQCKANTDTLARLRGEMSQAKEALAGAELQSRQAEELVARVQQEYDIFKPRIKDAIKVEEQIKGLENLLAENAAAQKRTMNESSRLTASVAADRETLRKITEEAKEIDGWFSERESYRRIIPEIPVIISDMQSVAETRSEIARYRKMLADTMAMHADNEKRLAEAKAKEEELAGTLSKEIAELRNRLIEGEPCPVCGSKHHELSSVGQKTLAETELEKARECIGKSIEHLTQSIETYNKNITSQQGSISIFETTVATLTARCMKRLDGLVESEDEIASADTIKRLDTLAKDWEKNIQRLAVIKEEVSVKTNALSFSEKRSVELEKELEERNFSIHGIEARIKECKEQLTTLLGKWNSREDAESHFEKSVSAANKAFSHAGEKRIAAAGRYNQLKGGIEENEKLIGMQQLSLKELDSMIEEYLIQRTDGMSREKLEGLLAPDNRVNEMRARVEEVKKVLLKATATLDERKRTADEHSKASTRPIDNCTMEQIVAATEEALALRASIADAKSSINATLMKDKEDNEKFNMYSNDCRKKQKTAEKWGELDSMFGSEDGNKLTRLTQGYTLDILLDVANMHLREFSGRYILSRISQSSLAIKVIDLEMMSDSRSVHTLSGGETFLASLALSLALSSVSSNKMNIESLFIDEGFGALDGETLKEAIDVLEKLQTMGRKIGVISHLGEMLQRIPTRIRVLKTGNGKSRIITE